MPFFATQREVPWLCLVISSISSEEGRMTGVLRIYLAELLAEGLIVFKFFQKTGELQYANKNSKLINELGNIPTIDWSNSDSSSMEAVGRVEVTIGNPIPRLK
ncbi:MAG: hypothetical protein R3E08_12750 [Thiotrichaceae bacterium]